MVLAATVRLTPLLISERVSVSRRALFNGDIPPCVFPPSAVGVGYDLV